jgi:hypothetical protein
MRKLWVSLALIFNCCLLSAADDSLILNLKLNEGQGDQVADSSGRNHNAKLINVEWVESGVEGKAVRLTGDKSYIDLGQNEDFSFTQDFTMSLWMNVGKFDKGGLSLFNRGNYNKGWQTYVYRSFIAMSTMALKGDMVYYRGIATGTFIQVVITGKKIDDQNTAISFYFDGKLGKTFTVQGQLPITNQITIGNFASAEGIDFNGVIDEVKIYNRPLSDKEIQEDFEKMSKASKPEVAPVAAAKP